VRLELNPKQLRVFYHVGKHLSFTKAAQELYVTQPAVAMQVKALEHSCGCTLVLRRNSRLELTEAGAVLYVYSERLVALLDEAEQALAQLDQTREAVLRIGTTKTWARYLMPAFVLRFQRAYPNVRIELLDASSADIAAAVAKAECDLGIVGRVPFDDRLLAIPFPGHEIDELVLVLPPDHRWARRETVSLAELVGERIILRRQGSGTRHVIEKAIADAGVDLDVMLEAGSSEFIKDLVHQGTGISILARLSVEEDARRGSLAAVSFADGGLYVPLDILLLKRAPHGQAMNAFLEFVGRDRDARQASAP
jgi:DNA-binding transcriptional LysR family regulator